MTDRLRLDQHSDDTLTALYDDLDRYEETIGELNEENTTIARQAASAEAERGQHAAQLTAILTAPDAPTHCHTQPAVWDGGGPCAYCTALAAARTALAVTQTAARRCTCRHPANEHSVYGCADWAEGSAPCTR